MLGSARETVAFVPVQPTHLHVLVVDDDPAECQLIRSLLAPYGMLVQEVFSVDEALVQLSEHAVDLVITDLLMPEVDGFELCRRIKNHSEWRYIPILVVSALDDYGNMALSVEAGADDFLYKPLDKTTFRMRVSALLRIRRQYCELRQANQFNDFENFIRLRAQELATAVRLSARETEVLALLLSGYGSEEIAILLKFSQRTAKFHTTNTLRKLGVESRHGLLRALFPTSASGPRT